MSVGPFDDEMLPRAVRQDVKRPLALGWIR
jgi:hypothetical protein